MGRSGAFAFPSPLRIGVFPYLNVIVVLHLVPQTSTLLHLFAFSWVHLPLPCVPLVHVQPAEELPCVSDSVSPLLVMLEMGLSRPLLRLVTA